MEIRNNKGFVKWLLIGVSVIFLLIMLVLPPHGLLQDLSFGEKRLYQL